MKLSHFRGSLHCLSRLAQDELQLIDIAEHEELPANQRSGPGTASLLGLLFILIENRFTKM